MKSYKHLQRWQKKQKQSTNKTWWQAFWCACVLHKARVRGGNANTEAASVLTVYTAVTCGFPGGPRPP